MNKNAGKEAYKKHWCDRNDLGMHLKKGVPSKQKQKDCHSQKRDNQQECDDIKLFGRENSGFCSNPFTSIFLQVCSNNS